MSGVSCLLTYGPFRSFTWFRPRFHTQQRSKDRPSAPCRFSDGGVFGVKENATTQYLKLELPLCLLGKGRELIGHRSRETKQKLISPKVFGSAGSGDRHTFRNQRVWGWPAFHGEPWPPAGSLLFLSGSEKHSH